MLSVLLSVPVAFLITYLVLPAIMRVASEKKLFDVPDARKLHTKHIASLGGVGIFLGFFLSTFLVVAYSDTQNFQYFFAAAVVIFFLGLKDDILILSARKKFLGQLGATAILVHLGGVRIDSMYGVLGFGNVPELLGIVLSYTTIMVIINAFNLIDGVDGLAGTLGLLSTSVFGAYFLFAGLHGFAALSFSMTAALTAFLVFNYYPAKIFMGDSGSLLLGMLNAILVIKFMTVASLPSAVFPVASVAAVGFSILIVPLLDTLRVFTIRLLHGRSPFSPDRNHIHHLLLDRGLSHNSVVLTCVGLNAAFIAMAWFGQSMGSTFLLVSMIAVAFAMLAGLTYLKKPKAKLVIAKSFQRNSETVLHSATKVVSINKEVAAMEQ